MATRRKRESNDSLDMLLDTITNTFGGLIFIAILVALLIGKKVPQTSKQEIQTTPDRDLKLELEQLTSKYEILQQEAQVARQFQNQFVSPEQKSMAEKLQQKELLVLGLNTRIETAKKQRQDFELDTERDRAILKNIEQENLAAKKRLEDLQRQLKTETQQRTSSLDSPVLRATSKRARILLVKRRKVFEIKDRSSASVNLNHFEKADALTAELNLGPKLGYWKSKSTAGVRMSDKSGLNEIWKSLNPTREFVQFAIFEDSFEDFKMVRELLVARKIEYSLLILKKDDQIVESSAASKPKVQ